MANNPISHSSDFVSLKVTDLRAGDSIEWAIGTGFVRTQGTVMYTDDEYAYVFPVARDDFGIKCCNDVGVGDIPDVNRHFVRLGDCPPPFDDLCANGKKGGCYAVADDKLIEMFTDNRLLLRKAIKIHKDSPLSGRDRKAIEDHLCRDGMELEKVWDSIRNSFEKKMSDRAASRARDADSMFGDIATSSDFNCSLEDGFRR